MQKGFRKIAKEFANCGKWDFSLVSICLSPSYLYYLLVASNKSCIHMLSIPVYGSGLMTLFDQ